jgi:hypothetical protein
MRFSYTGVPLNNPNPATKESKVWIPMLWVRVGANHQRTPRFSAVVDSGSDTCLFKMELAEYLKLDLSKRNVGTTEIGGIFQGMKQTVFYCPVQLYVADSCIITVTAGFLKKLTCTGILGRNGFFDAFKVSFDHLVSPPAFEIERTNKPI